ncbi:hypothetical protein KGA66_01910 [Actinocrinis puniceicyclus]|uniref:N-acetyltransferase domain-containing protein n=1 Tax=Actinocrinis puniceicyclus TaxID=977794 RepID=A0A8J7WGE6_9ACTN|nr:GNAT family N-acetyltransferase [Actinocrinis puniceicyclus]MBS2961786.1 hypothetical protein [Actinocrinis puniceicyclus]
MTDVLIRETRAGDGPDCAEIWREAGRYFAAINPGTFRVPGLDGLSEWFEEVNAVYRDDEDKTVLVAEADGVLIGSVAVSLQEPVDRADRQVQTDLSRRRLHVDGLAVRETHRRGGAVLR